MTGQLFIGQLRADDNLTTPLTMTVDLKQKDNLPARKKKIFYFLPAQASTFQFCFGSVYLSKVKAKLKRACPPPHQEKRTKNRNMITFATDIQTQEINEVLKMKILIEGQKPLRVWGFFLLKSMGNGLLSVDER